ncbi:MAG: serine hydrolase domain-containing protein, partial [Anaerolineaceae bacterium]
MPAKTNRFDAYDDRIPRLMADWRVPGCVVAVVQDGAILHWRGYGFRDVEKRLPVDLDTIFAIGSTSKAFTSAAAAVLVDQGLLDWDTPVKHYIPEFDLVDAFAADRMTVRDLLSHRSGLPRHDGVWYGTSFSRKEVFDRLRYLTPSADFRTMFQYQNLMFMAAGYLIERITGQT